MMKLGCLLIFLTPVFALAQDWQWSTPVKGGKANPDARAWLWIPPSCQKVKAVILTQNNMEELSIVENQSFRQSMSGLGIAEVWVSPMFDHMFRFNEGAGEVFNKMMNDLADASGYPELRNIPIIGMGHSAAASWPYYFAAWAPERTLACISVSGQWPYFRDQHFAPDIWAKDQNVDGIPCLETMGEYEAADTWSAEGLKERTDHPATPLSMLACPAEGHFAASQEKINFIAFYIKKAVQYRGPDLKKIDPQHTGWLMERWHANRPPENQPAPVNRYKGDPKDAFWFFDEETVRAVQRYQSKWRNRPAPLLAYLQNGQPARQHNTHLQITLSWEPQPDGISFVLKPAWQDTVPGESPRPAIWTGLKAGAKAPHPQRTAAITINRVVGPMQKINDTLWRLALQKESFAPQRFNRYSLTFAAIYPGDSEYKPAVQQAEMNIPLANRTGIAQHLDFPPIPDQQPNAPPIALKATSDKGLPVSYTVIEGPAIIKGDSLYLTRIPPRSRYPVKVTVMAWQYGNKTTNTAQPIPQTFQITEDIPVEKIIHLAEQQYNAYIKTHESRIRYPRSTKPDGSLVETGPEEWTSGFFPGCLWYLYRLTNKDHWREAADKWTRGLDSQQYNTTTHDLGFMLNDSYGLGYDLTNNPTYKSIIEQGARSLSKRFHPEVGAIRSWDNPEFHYPVIIDNLMNLEFLFRATKLTGDSSFYKIAVAHANTDLKYRFRPDNSSYHVLDFDPVTGNLLRRMTHQGYSDSSCWSRGQAWGIYGYTTLYRETKDKRYLDRAIKTADYFIAQTDKTPDHIPYWDFQAPDSTHDASAAAIAASAMFDLSTYAGEKYRKSATQLLASLCTDRYLGDSSYFLLKHSTGHKPHNSEVDVPIIYADYYFLEALWRYQQSKPAHLQSPDGRITASIYQKDKKLFYTVEYDHHPIILESQLDILMDNHILESALALKPDTAADWCADLNLSKRDTTSRDTTWHPLYGEKAEIRDHYNELTLTFHKAGRPAYSMQLIFKAYNEGVAFRYYFPENPTGVYYHITAENTDFTFPEGTKAWFTSWAQGAYKLLPLKSWPDQAERPLPLQLPDSLYACLAEAQMTDYARTKFQLYKPNTIRTALYSAVDNITWFGTPWRTIILGKTPGDLIGNKDLLLNLNPPSEIQSTSWIKPGKIFRDMTLTTQGAKESIDFAAAHKMQYILFDWKWYGPAATFNTDATKVVAPIDMPAVVAYGKQKGIGIWLYVNMQSLLTQLDTILPLYEKWGIKGIKLGFVELGSQRWTVWLEEAIRKAAAHHLLVNIHDDWRPTGEQRTWPNLLTAEGIRGNEEMPDATHNTILPFTRYIAGPADYTICYYSPRIRTTHAHQLALACVYYSPLLTLFWYDKPKDFHQEPEIEFFEKIPVTWDQTKSLGGAPGEYVSIARRKNNDWFIGTITNDSARMVTINFDFLNKTQHYLATIYSDDPAAQTATHVRRTQQIVDYTTILQIPLQPSGGEAIWLAPTK